MEWYWYYPEQQFIWIGPGPTHEWFLPKPDWFIP